MAAAVFGLIGVIVGGVINFVATVYQQRGVDRSARHSIARLTYDDFLHYQSTLVRALAGSSWWPDSALLKPQTKVGDRKIPLVRRRRHLGEPRPPHDARGARDQR